MNKKINKYTILTVVLTIVFSLSSMTGMNLILRIREHQFLSEHGETLMEGIAREWQKPEKISVDKIEEVLTKWESDGRIIVHAPVKGQISMEQAVRAGKTWLTQIDLVEYDWEKDEESQTRSVYATLGGPWREEEDIQLKPYHSFWMVHISSQSIEGVLFVNAVTAEVWRADLTIYKGLPERMPYWKLKDFLELSGLTPYYKGAVRNGKETAAVWEAADTGLCARMKYLYRWDSGYRKDLPDFGKGVIDDNTTKGEYVTLFMKLSMRKGTEGNEKP